MGWGTADVFDVPILGQIAAILFEVLDADTNAPLKAILARTESVQVGNCLMELAQAGEEKGNFQSRLKGALDTIERYRAREQNGRVKSAQDRTEYLRQKYENTGKENPHSVGMV